MNRTAWIAAIVAVLLVLGITAWLVMGMLSAPVFSLQARTCIGCVETHTGSGSSVRAGTLSGDYRFRRQAPYVIRFRGGSVEYEGEELEPGCHTGMAARGDTVSFDGATDVLFAAPPPDEPCG